MTRPAMISWQDPVGITHAVTPSPNHEMDWDVACGGVPSRVGAPRKDVIESFQAAVNGGTWRHDPITCLRCLVLFKE